MKFVSNDLLLSAIKNAECDDLKPIFEQLRIPYRPTYPANFLVSRISQTGGHSFLNLFRDDESVGYLEILADVAGTLGMRAKSDVVRDSLPLDKKPLVTDVVPPQSAVGGLIAAHLDSLELAILQHVAQGIWSKMTAVQRSSFEETLAQIAADHGQSPKKLIYGAGGALVLANMGGFGTYMVMASLLHTVSFGLLGFGAYTAASSIVAVALGPVGWAALAGYAVFKFGSPSMQKLIPIVITVALIRQKKMHKPPTLSI